MNLNKDEFEPFFNPNTISDCKVLLEIYTGFFLSIITDQTSNEEKLIENKEAKLVLQMMMTRCANLKNTLDGLNFKNKNIHLREIIDPTIISSLVRSIYEMTGMFNLIFINTKDSNEQKILYLLWVHAGLAYRQRFTSLMRSKEDTEKIETELKQMQDIVLEIKNNEKYKNLNERNQEKIQNRIDKKEYLIEFIGNEVSFLSWKDLVNTMGITKYNAEQIYTYFSLYSHPSNVSVFQFATMFNDKKQTTELILFNLQLAVSFFSIFTTDYIRLFPKSIKIFEELPLKNQIIINFYNSFARGRGFDINDALEKL